MFRIAVAALVACMATAASAQQLRCGPAEKVGNALKQKFGESVVMRGMDTRNIIIEWWLNEETGSWTLLELRPTGVRCLIASGDSSEAIAPEPAGLRL